MPSIKIVILAAGHGKRMNNDSLPKVLIPLNGKPLIVHLLESVKQSGLNGKPVIVVGKMADQVKAELGSDYHYVLQAEQLGTGHAVNCTRQMLEGNTDIVLVLYGDMPLVSAQTIKKIADVHAAAGGVLTMATFTVPDFADWRQGFFSFGRVLRDAAGNVSGIVERKDASPQQLEIKELNPAYFCFTASWLWNNLDQIRNENNQHEYYLTDLVALACQQGHPIKTVEIDPHEALGVNQPENLKVLEDILRR